MQDPAATLGNKRIAMLIDGENAQAALIAEMIAEASKYGLVTIRRVYGDWSSPEMRRWKDILDTYAVLPQQQFRYAVGKNATDIALIIDAMDILHDGTINGFCLVSSDSDYTRLAMRIREKGLFVMGIGKENTPRGLVNACEVFVYTENLLAKKDLPKSPQVSREAKVSGIPADPVTLLKNAFDMAVQEDGWAFLALMGERLKQRDPGFDPRTYGFKQLNQLIRANSNTFEIKEVKSRSGPSQVFVKLKDERIQ